MPLVAILRGIQPNEIEDIGRVLIDEGFWFIEVPLNSPDVWESIRRLKSMVPENVLIGAGTVIDGRASVELAELGAVLQVTPNTDVDVIQAGKVAGLATFTGFMWVCWSLCSSEAEVLAKLYP